MAEKRSSIIDADDLLVTWKFISKNGLLLLLLPALFAGAAYFYVHRLPDEYGAKTEILLGSGSGYEYQSQIYRNLTGYGGGGVSQITNQIRVLQSHDLISKALDKLNFQTSYYIVGRVKTTQIPQIDAFDVQIQLVESGGEQLYGVLFDVKVIDRDTFQLRFQKGDESVPPRRHAFNTDIVEGEYLLRLQRNDYLSKETFKRLRGNDYRFVVNSKQHLINTYRKGLIIRNEEKTSILEISIKDYLGSNAKNFLDSLSASYIDYTIESQIKLNENTLDYIDSQLKGVTFILDSIETTLENFKDAKDILDLNREQSEFFEKLLSFESERRTLRLKIETLASLETYLLKKTDERLLPPALYITDDAFLKSSLTELYNLEVQRGQAAFDVKENSPGSERIDRTIQSLRSNIIVYINNLRKAINDRTSDVSREIAFYESKLRVLPQSQREMLNIQRNLDVNEKMYVYLLEKKANTIIARAAIVPEVSVIEVARVIGVVGPEKLKIVYYFLAAGLIIALIIAFIRTAFFDRIQTTRELKQITNIPVIGTVPGNPKIEQDRLVVVKNARSNIAEAFRGIRTNLQYFNEKPGSKVILLTSLHPGEGKTFCSINTGAIIASAGKKVLLLDFDMHKPKVHESLELANLKGLSTYIGGRDNLAAVIQETVLPGLDVITAGPIPPNASELILSSRVDELFESVRKQYDYIIVDTPPIMLISDSMVLIRKADVSMFVLNTEKATRQGVRHLEELIEMNHLNHTSLILNNVQLKRWRYYYGKYSYGGSYGYYTAGYGRDDN